MVTHTFCMRKTMTFLYQNKDVTEIENVLNNKFASVCKRFVDNRLSVHFVKITINVFFSEREKPARA